MGDRNLVVSVQGSELTWFLGGSLNPLGYFVWIEIDLVFVSEDGS